MKTVSFTSGSGSVDIEVSGEEAVTLMQPTTIYTDDSTVSFLIDNTSYSFKVTDSITIDGVAFSGTLSQLREALENVFPGSAPVTALPTETLPTYAAMQASITSDPTTKRDFFVTADETNGGVATSYRYNGSSVTRLGASSISSPASIDTQPIQIAAYPTESKYSNGRKYGEANSKAAYQVDLPLHLGTRRNLWQYTEDLASSRYVASSGTKQTDSIIVDGITLTRVSTANFFSSVRSQVNGLGLTPYTTGQRYLISCYVLSRYDAEQFVWQRGSIVNSGSNGHGAKVITNRMRRIWSVVQATTTSNVATIGTPTTALGGEAGADTYWLWQGTTEGSLLEVYIGGFQIELITDSTYKDGIAIIGDSTMAGSSGGKDAFNTTREVSTWLGALLNVNVFNRGLSGDRLDQMDARWATDITPLAVNSKYVIIQGGINDISQGTRTLADMQASVNSMVAKAATDGLTPILFTCTPTSTIGANSTKEALRNSFNTWLKQAFPRVIDIASVVQDPYNSAILRNQSGWVGDGTHYGAPAKRAVGIYAASWPGWDFVTPSPYQKIAVATYTPTGAVYNNGVQVVGAQQTGWTAGTGTPNKGAFAADTATAAQAAQRVLAIEQALRTHGLIN